MHEGMNISLLLIEPYRRRTCLPTTLPLLEAGSGFAPVWIWPGWKLPSFYTTSSPASRKNLLTYFPSTSSSIFTSLFIHVSTRALEPARAASSCMEAWHHGMNSYNRRQDHYCWESDSASTIPYQIHDHMTVGACLGSRIAIEVLTWPHPMLARVQVRCECFMALDAHAWLMASSGSAARLFCPHKCLSCCNE